MKTLRRIAEFAKGRTSLRIRKIPAFTLVELIVVITILAILATVGFLSLSGYTDDARSATVAANVRTVYSAILSESTTSGNSPRFYIDHDPAAALSGAVAFVDGNPVVLTGGQWGSGGTNYSAGNPRWDRLRMNGDKFRLAFAAPEGIAGFGGIAESAWAAYDTGAVSVGAFDASGKPTLTGKSKPVTYFQVVGVSPSTKKASVTGNYLATVGGISGLVRDSSQANPTVAISDTAATAGNVAIAGNDSAGRKWSDGTSAVSCSEYKAPPLGKSYAGAIGDGTYWIDPDGAGGSPEYKAYCDMSANGGGWTLVLKASGTSANFAYDSPNWTNTGTLNPDAYAFDTLSEFKSPAFSNLPFSSVMLAMSSSGAYNAVVIPKVSPSLYSVFSSNVFQPTSLGRAAWKSLVPNSSLQPNCNKEGFNNYFSGTRIRLGIYANQENDCASPDSRLGIGGAGTYCGQIDANSVGNAATCSADNGDADIRSFGFLFVR